MSLFPPLFMRLAKIAFYTRKKHLKALFLPDEASEELTLPAYVKYQEMPDGKLMMVGSTTKLTTKGMSLYFEQLYAYAVTELDVRFTANV